MGHVVLLPQAADACLSSVYREQRRATSLESTLVEVFILNTLNPFRMNTCRAKPHFAQFWCNVSSFRINTCKSVSKQMTLSTFRINTYEKTGGRGGVLPTVQSFRSYSPYTLPSSVSCKSFACHSYENTWGVYPKFPVRNSLLTTRHWIREGASCYLIAYGRPAGARTASFISLLTCLQESRWP